MSALAGLLTERVVVLERDPARDDLGGASGAWREGRALWAALRPDGAGAGDDVGALPRWIATLRTTPSNPVPERLRWRDRVLAVRRAVSDPAAPDRITLFVEELR